MRTSQIVLKLDSEQNRTKNLQEKNTALKDEIVGLKQEIKVLKCQLRCWEKNEFEVDQILDDKIENGEQLYLVRWKHFGNKYDTWEKKDNLKCPKILAAYIASKQLT